MVRQLSVLIAFALLGCEAGSALRKVEGACSTDGDCKPPNVCSNKLCVEPITNIGENSALSGISPATGPTSGGTLVSISGTKLDRATSAMIGGASCSGVLASSTEFRCTTGPSVAGVFDVTVGLADGTSLKLAQAFTYVATT